MPEMIEISYAPRQACGSAVARRLRRAGSVPAVVYGGGETETGISIVTSEFMKKVGYASSGMMTLVGPGGDRTMAIIKEIQWNHLTDMPLHIDFYRVSVDQMVSVRVPVHFEGTPKGLVFGGVLDQLVHEIQIKVKASAIPHDVSIDVSGLDIGDTLHVGDLTLPEGAVLETSVEQALAHVVPPTVEKAKPAEAGEAAEEQSEKEEE
jgi:large subunit ribosomal protein L25